jgi:hypothetical protein
MRIGKCECGFKFSKPGEFRNCVVYLNKENKWVKVCPKCEREYLIKE